MFIQSHTGVTEALLARLKFTSYNSIVEARALLAQQIRLTMQYPQTYQTPIEQFLPDGVDVGAAAQYVHPYNLATALINVCLNGPRFGGDAIAPQEDLLLWTGAEWTPLHQCTCASAVVPMAGTPQAEEVPITSKPAAEPEPAAAAPPATTQAPVKRDEYAPVNNDLPSSDISLERTGQSGRPQKSPFEKKVEPRNKVAPAPFWWESLMRSAPKIFTVPPASGLDDSSTGAGPVQSYMILLALLQVVLKGVDARISVASLRTHLREIDEQVSKLDTAEAINQLRKLLVDQSH